MDTEERTSTKTKKKMDLEGLSVICSDLGEPEEDGDGRRIGYSKSDYCLGIPLLLTSLSSPMNLI